MRKSLLFLMTSLALVFASCKDENEDDYEQKKPNNEKVDEGKEETIAPVPANQTGLRFDYDKSTMTASVTHLFSYNEYEDRIGENYDFTEVKIPSQVLYDGNVYDVTTIGREAFKGCENLTSIEIPNSVTTIGDRAFDDCTSLTSIEIPNSVTTIGIIAFAGCESLTSIVIPNSVTTIGYEAFWGCTSLTSIVIPNSVTEIGSYEFAFCESLTSIVVDKDNKVYDSRENCNAIIKTASNTLVAGCQNTIIPNSVTEIRGGAFMGCTSLTSIEIPNSVTEIGYEAFCGCSKLKTARVPKNCKYSIYYCSFPNECTIIKY